MIPVPDLIDYISKRYGASDKISSTMLSYIIFLIDWRHAVATGEPLSNASWVLTENGPLIPNLFDELTKVDGVALQILPSSYGESSIYIQTRPWLGRFYNGPLKKKDRSFVDSVLYEVSGLNPNEFLNAVEFAYPILSSNVDESLNLGLLSTEYKERETWFRNRERTNNQTNSYNNLDPINH